MADTVADWKDRVAYWRDRAERAEARLAAAPAFVEAMRQTYDKLCLIVGGLAYDDASATAMPRVIDDLNDVCEIPRAALARWEQTQNG